MERLGGEDAGQSASIGRVALASFVGTAIEGYDFFIYGIAAALVFGQLFFPPNEDPLIGTLAAFATFAVGFVARPVGGVVFGHFGDKVGRKPMLVITILTMGLATFLIGLLPTYAQIGIWAPILLVALRLIQGFSAGGEWGGAALMTVEHAPKGRRGYYGSWTMAAASAGVMLATGVYAAFSGLSDEQFLAWGWRVPFLLSIFLVGVGVFIRFKILETPTFARLKEAGVQARMPIVEALREHPKSVLLTAGMNVGFSTFVYVLFLHAHLRYGTAGSRKECRPDRDRDRRADPDRLRLGLLRPHRSHRPAAGDARRGSVPGTVRLPPLLVGGSRERGRDRAGHEHRVFRLGGYLRPDGRLFLRNVQHEGALHWGILRLPDGSRAGRRPLAVHRHRAARMVGRRVLVGIGVPGPGGHGELGVHLPPNRDVPKRALSFGSHPGEKPLWVMTSHPGA